MMKRVWKLGSAVVASAMGVTLLACSDTNTAGTTFETENDIALTVLNGDGTPAANARVLVRRVDYVAGSVSRDYDDTYGSAGESPIGAMDTIVGIFNAVTDVNGQVTIKARMKPTNYVIEARGEVDKAVSRLSITEKDSLYPVEMTLSAPGVVSGQVYLPHGVRTATVGVQGIDYFVRTDTLGNFVFESLPEGTFNVVGYVVREQTSDMGDDAEPVESHQALGFTSTKVRSDKETVNIQIGNAPVQDTVTYPEYLFENFENGVASWYKTVARYASAELSIAESVAGREGKVAHFEYSIDSLYNWVLFGYPFPKMQDFSELDSIVLWVRGTAVEDSAQWVSVSMDVLIDDSTSQYKSGKAWAHVFVNNEWTRYVVTPADFRDSTDTNGGNLGWDAVKDHVTNFNIFGGGGSNEVWVDDIEFYGVTGFDRPL